MDNHEEEEEMEFHHMRNGSGLYEKSNDVEVTASMMSDMVHHVNGDVAPNSVCTAKGMVVQLQNPVSGASPPTPPCEFVKLRAEVRSDLEALMLNDDDDDDDDGGGGGGGGDTSSSAPVISHSGDSVRMPSNGRTNDDCARVYKGNMTSESVVGSDDDGVGKRSPLGDAIGGQIGGLFAQTLAQPLDVVKTHLQMLGAAEKYNGFFHAFYLISRERGFFGLFAGIQAEWFKTALASFLYFYSYSWLKREYERGTLPLAPPASQPPRRMGVVYNLAVGIVCGCIQQTCITPISVAQAIMLRDNTSLLRTWINIVKSDGFFALWKGLSPSLILTINPAIQFFVYDRVKVFWQQMVDKYGKEPRELTALEHFMIGAVAKFVATICTYPLIIARTRLFLRDGTTGTILGALMSILATDGFSGLYYGVEAQLVKSVYAAGLKFSMKEYVDALAQSIARFIIRFTAASSH